MKVDNADIGKTFEANAAAQPALADLQRSRRELPSTRTVLKRSQSENRFISTSRAADSGDIDLYHARAVSAETTGTVPAFMPSGRRSRSQDATTKASFMTVGLDFSSKDPSPTRERQLSLNALYECSERPYERGARTDTISSSEYNGEVVKVIREDADGIPILSARDREVTYTRQPDGSMQKTTLVRPPSSDGGSPVGSSIRHAWTVIATAM